MKKSQAIQLIKNKIKNLDTKTLKSLLAVLEKEGLICPIYFTKDGHGMHNINYGWEPERKIRNRR